MIITPEFETGDNVTRYPRRKTKPPPNILPAHSNNPVDHSARIGYVHSTAHSNETGNNGSKKKPIKPIEIASG